MKSAAAVGAVSAFGLPLAASRPARAVTQPNGATLYGTQTHTGDVYAIEVDTGNVYQFVDLDPSSLSPSFSAGPTSPNGNAYDVENERFYFASYSSGTTSDLYFADLTEETPTVTHAGALQGASASGTFYEGAYWYVRDSSDDLIQVTVDGDGYVDGEAKVADIAGGSGLYFGDIAFDSDGLLYVSAQSGSTVYHGTYDLDTEEFTEWTEPWDRMLQIAFAGDDRLFGHNTNTGQIYEIDTSDGALTELFTPAFDENTLFLTDLAGNRGVGACSECTEDEEDPLAKYEFACVDYVDDECQRWDFVLDGTGDDGISYTAGSFESKDGEEFEPTTVEFDTDYCDLYALVKSGQEFEVQDFENNGGSVTVETANDKKYAISFVAFYCDRNTAEVACEDFPSKNGDGNGGNGGRATRR